MDEAEEAWEHGPPLFSLVTFLFLSVSFLCLNLCLSLSVFYFSVFLFLSLSLCLSLFLSLSLPVSLSLGPIALLVPSSFHLPNLVSSVTCEKPTLHVGHAFSRSLPSVLLFSLFFPLCSSLSVTSITSAEEKSGGGGGQ